MRGELVQHANYIRLYSDEKGESHFEDLETELVPVDFAPPAAPLNIAQFLPATQSLWVGAPVGWAGDEPHPSPRRQIFCTLQGGTKSRLATAPYVTSRQEVFSC